MRLAKKKEGILFSQPSDSGVGVAVGIGDVMAGCGWQNETKTNLSLFAKHDIEKKKNNNQTLHPDMAAPILLGTHIIVGGVVRSYNSVT